MSVAGCDESSAGGYSAEERDARAFAIRVGVVAGPGSSCLKAYFELAVQVAFPQANEVSVSVAARHPVGPQTWPE
jgi:hypothetical protein